MIIRKILFSLCMLSFIYGTSQTISPKEMSKHLERVQQSKQKSKVIRSLDTVFNAGIPYCIMTDQRKGLVKDHKIFGLNGQLLFEITWDCINQNGVQKCFYAVLFPQTAKRAELESYIGLKLEELIVESNLVQDNQVPAQSETLFLMKYPPRFSQPNQPAVQINVIQNNPYPVVVRNKQAAIEIKQGNIYQDNVIIGKITESTSNADGKILKIYQVSLPNGTPIARISQVNTAGMAYTIFCNLDHANHAFNVKFIGKEAEEFAQFLVENQYL